MFGRKKLQKIINDQQKTINDLERRLWKFEATEEQGVWFYPWSFIYEIDKQEVTHEENYNVKEGSIE
ncbi:MAG: hypothetical protein QXP13_06430 [Candidatus Methanomethylicia archaeon]